MDSEKIFLQRGAESVGWTSRVASSSQSSCYPEKDATNSAFPFFKQEWFAQLPQNLTPLTLATVPSNKLLRDLFSADELD